jgi:DNA-binding response OmpR family regulator
MLAELMLAHGIDATCVPSVVEAWSKIHRNPFDLYLLDGWLPGVDGFHFCRQLRQFDAKTPILFYSAAAYETDRKKGIAAGANAYIVKPDIEGLIEKVQELTVRSIALPSTAQLDSQLGHTSGSLVFATSG